MQTLKKYYSALFVSFLYVAHLINLSIWLKLDRNYLTYDSHRYFLASLNIYDKLTHFLFQPPGALMFFCKRHPPLGMLVSSLFYPVCGASQDAGVFCNSAVFLFILMFSVYRIAAIVLPDRKSACFAVFIVTMYPVVFNQMKMYMLDLPLMSLAALAVYVLIAIDKNARAQRTKIFRLGRLIVFFFIVVLSGMLIKSVFLLFILFPALIILPGLCRNVSFKSFLSGIKGFARAARVKIRDKRRALGIVAVAVLCAVIAAIFTCYYFSEKINIAGVGDGPLTVKMSNAVKSVIAGPDYLLTWPSVAPHNNLLRRIHALAWYVWGFVNWQVSFLFFVLFVFGSVAFAQKDFPYKGAILAWLIGGWLVMGSLYYGVGVNMEVSAVRYTMPILPAAAIISAALITVLKHRGLRKLILGAVVVLAVLQFLCVSYPVGRNITPVLIPVTVNDPLDFLPESFIVFQPNAWAVSGSDSGSHPKDYTRYRDICDGIMRIISAEGSPRRITKVLVIPDDTRLWYLQYLAVSEHGNIVVRCDRNDERAPFSNEDSIRTIIGESDYVIDKTGDWQGEADMLPMVNDTRRLFNREIHKFKLLRAIPYPDGARILVYKGGA
jgi:hypothetical protein